MCDEEADGDLDERAQGREGGAPRRTTERKLRRANAGGTERGREGEGVGEDAHHHAKLQGGSSTTRERRNGGITESSELPTMAAAAARVSQATAVAAGFGFQGRRGSAFYRPE